MSGLIEIKEQIKRIYIRNEVFITPILKFVMALIVFGTINGRIGYYKKIDSPVIVLILALLSSFLPLVVTSLIAGLIILVHMFGLAMECALVAGVVMLIMFILYLRLVPKEAVVVLLTPVLFMLKVPYLIPVVMGLVGTPLSVVSVSCGVILAYIIEFANENATTITTLDDGNMISRIRFIVDGMLGNKTMFITIIAFAITVLLVYTLRRRSDDYIWTIATIAGAVCDALILLICDLVMGLQFSILGIILGSILAVAVGLVLQFFVFHLDYEKTENLQFEDDDYYYYVKAVPKVSVEPPKKTVKRINSAQGSSAQRTQSASRRPQSTSQTQSQNRSQAGRTVHTANGTTKTMRK